MAPRTEWTDDRLDDKMSGMDGAFDRIDAELRVTRLELRSEMSEMRLELRSEMSEMRTELRSEMSEMRTELKSEMSEMRTELKSEMSELRAEFRTGLSALGSSLDELRDKMMLAGFSLSTGLLVTGVAIFLKA